MKILTFNVLAQTLIKRSLYPYATKSALKQADRIPKIVDLLLNDHKPDIACLQEVDLFDMFYKTRLEDSGYDFEYLRKDETKVTSHGIVICWKREL